MTSKERPPQFMPILYVSGVIVRVGDETLLLKRAPYKKVGANQWALVAGKREENESDIRVAKRELFEEVGIDASEDSLTEVGIYYHSPYNDPDYQIVWNIFCLTVEEKPEITLNKEHTEYAWVHKDEYKNFDLMDGEEFCLDDYFAQLN